MRKLFLFIFVLFFVITVVADGNAQTPTTETTVTKKVRKPKGPQCEATTKAGKQCMRSAVAGGKFCKQHSTTVGGDYKNRCHAKTAEGKQCSRNAIKGGEYCTQHAKMKDSPKQ